MGIGKNVAHLREKRGLTLDAVALAVGTNAQAISQMEKRESKTSSFSLKLAKYFGVDLAALLLPALAGCANIDTVALQRALEGANQMQNDRVMRDAALNQRMTMQRQQYQQPTVQTSPNMMVLPGYLKGQSVSGTLRYCSYSNGVVATVSSVDLCPMNTQ